MVAFPWTMVDKAWAVGQVIKSSLKECSCAVVRESFYHRMTHLKINLDAWKIRGTLFIVWKSWYVDFHHVHSYTLCQTEVLTRSRAISKSRLNTVAQIGGALTIDVGKIGLFVWLCEHCVGLIVAYIALLLWTKWTSFDFFAFTFTLVFALCLWVHTYIGCRLHLPLRVNQA